MEEAEWSYMGEGGKHVIFAYKGARAEWRGRVLRLRKQDLARSQRMAGRRPSAVVPSEDALYYIRDIVSPLLTHYIDIPEVVDLDWEFVECLRDQAVESSSRKQEWEQKRDSNDGASHAVAQLLYNYRQMNRPSNKKGCLCIEVKPKAGYTAFSPLVDPKHCAKFESTRFEILQQLHCNGHISKGWNTEFSREKFRSSLYNPLGMFSHDFSCIQRELSHLLDVPQNNLRVWLNDILLVGNDKKQVLPEAMSFFDDNETQNMFFDTLVSCMAHILQKEELLPKIQRLQRLDVVDADGAILIYEKLTQLCGKQTDVLLDGSSQLKRNQTDHDGVLVASPFERPPYCPALDALLLEIHDFSSRLKASVVPPVDELDQARARSMSHVQSLSREACIYLLKNWLLSLAMCDISFFLVLCPIDTGELNEHGIDIEAVKYQEFKDDCCVFCQTGDNPGVLIRNGMGAFIYSLKVVDCDMKPASKLRSRKKKEEPIQFYKKPFE